MSFEQITDKDQKKQNSQFKGQIVIYKIVTKFQYLKHLLAKYHLQIKTKSFLKIRHFNKQSPKQIFLNFLIDIKLKGIMKFLEIEKTRLKLLAFRNLYLNFKKRKHQMNVDLEFQKTNNHYNKLIQQKSDNIHFYQLRIEEKKTNLQTFKINQIDLNLKIKNKKIEIQNTEMEIEGKKKKKQKLYSDTWYRQIEDQNYNLKKQFKQNQNSLNIFLKKMDAMLFIQQSRLFK